MKKSKPAGSKQPSAILEFEVSGSSNTLRLAGFRESETRAEFYDDLGNWWRKSPKDLADEIDELPPLAYEVQSNYADFRDNLVVLINEASGEKKPDITRIVQLKTRLASMPEEPEGRKLDLEQARIDQATDLAQVDVNKSEAASSNFLVSGWRPAVGWLDVVGLAYQFLVHPLMHRAWAVGQGVDLIPQGLSAPPDLDVEQLMVLLSRLMGFGGMRSFEKHKGVASK